MKKLITAVLGLGLFCSVQHAQAQEDLLSLIEEEPTTEYAKASFKTTRVINGHSLENVAGGVLDFRISHRFGFLNSGAYELFGLDNATIRLGLDYGLSNRIMVGVGRSSFNKTYDAYTKIKLLHQSSGQRNMPVTVSVFSGAYMKTIKFPDPGRENFTTSRMEFAHQLIIGRKFSEGTTLQLMPTLVHRNLIPDNSVKHDVLALGVAARQKLSKRVAINAEYYYVLPDQIARQYHNSLSVGFDIETGGHVFQLHFTNSTGMTEPSFITETVGNPFDGDVHFGFNISRVFTIRQQQRD